MLSDLTHAFLVRMSRDSWPCLQGVDREIATAKPQLFEHIKSKNAHVFSAELAL